MRIGFDSSSWTGLWMLSFPPASFVSENRTRIFSSWRWTSPRHQRGRLSISKTPRSSSKSQKVWGFEAFFTRTTNPPAPNWLRLDCRTAKESPMKPADSNSRNRNLETSIEHHERTTKAARPGPEPLARQHHSRPTEQWHAQTPYWQVIGDRADLKPDHF